MRVFRRSGWLQALCSMVGVLMALRQNCNLDYMDYGYKVKVTQGVKQIECTHCKDAALENINSTWTSIHLKTGW